MVTDPTEIDPWLTDWRGRARGRARAILAPTSTKEVAAVVQLAAEHRVPLVPQGGNTSMVAGATPPANGSALILSLRKMNRIRAIATDQAIAEGGVILADLHDAAAAQNLRFPLSLGAKGSATIGGLVSTNAGGTQVLRFGTMRALVLGLEAVLPDGSIYSGLTGLRKDSRGYSVDQLLIGAEGTLGVVTAAALKLVPALAGRAVAWAGVTSPQRALDLLRFLELSTMSIEAFEIVPRDSLALVLEHIPGTRNPLAGEHPWHVLIEATTESQPESLTTELADALGRALAKGLIADAVVASSETQAAAFWRIRESISEAERATGASLAHDISVAVADMPHFMIAAAGEVERIFPYARASGFGHLGDGNIHFHVRSGDASRLCADSEAITRLVHDLVTAAGGSISAEHGIGQAKLDEFERLTPPARLSALRAIKQALDPHGLMNPGKLVRTL